jgi:hypothetical protein
MLFGLVVCVVMSLPFVFHWWGLGASDPGTEGTDGASLVAAALVDPYVQAANDQALAEGRATTLADVAAGLPAPTSTAAAPDPAESGLGIAAPVFTVTADRITAQVTTSGSPVTCVITISAGKAVDRC